MKTKEGDGKKEAGGEKTTTNGPQTTNEAKEVNEAMDALIRQERCDVFLTHWTERVNYYDSVARAKIN